HGLVSAVHAVPAAVAHESADSSQELLHCAVHGLPACPQTPRLQVSAPLQNTPSLHVPVLFACWQLPPAATLHVSVVHGFASSQGFVTPPPQTPRLQCSLTVQNAPSSQGAVLKLCWHVPEASQTSSVQGLPSSVHAVPTGAAQ